jgi:protocatechuate 3,4-dioxygenase beta subunit
MKNHRQLNPLVGVAAVFVTLLFGQFLLPARGQSTSQSASQTAVIQGTVLRAGTGQPLKRARVSLRRVNGIAPQLPYLSVAPASVAPSGALVQQVMVGVNNTQAVTDDAGRYVFTGVAPGQYRLAIDRDGYIHQEFGQRTFTGPGTIITVAAGQQLPNLDIQMVPAGSISGRIFNEDGEPVAGLQVQAESYTYQQGKRVRAPSGQSGQTNDLGEYRIYWLTPGEYFVSAIARRGGVMTVNPVINLQQQAANLRNGGQAAAIVGVPQQRNEDTYAPTYFPGTVVPESASAVPVAPSGDVRGIDFSVRPTPTVSVRGQIIVPISSAPAVPGQRGNPELGINRGPQMNVMLNRAVLPGSFSVGGLVNMNRVSFSPDGHFEVSNVIPGSYNLFASAQQNGQQYSAQMKLEVGEGGIDNINIPVRAGVSVPGRIFLDGSLPSGFKISQLRVLLQQAEDAPVPNRGGGPGQVADDGTFTLTSVTPMTYRVRVVGLPAGAYLMAGRIGNEEAVNQPFAITGDQDVSLQLQIGFSAGRVTGTVVDDKGNPYPGVLATLIPDEPARLRSELYLTTPTDQYGHFTFANVPPGGYKLFAWEDISGDAYQDPQFIQRYEARGIPVKVDGGASVDQQVGITRQ